MRSSRGFTLVEIAVVMVIFAIVVAMAAVITRAVTAGQKRSITSNRMAAVDVAIAQFVAVQRRLPCPADGRNASGVAAAGTESARDVAVGCTAQQFGVVPWRALGLSEEDASDGWDHRFTYRAWGALAADNGMNMSMCDPAGTVTGGAVPVCATSCSSTSLSSCTVPREFLMGKGWEVRTISAAPVVTVMDPNGDPPTGAAYVLISHGESGGGGYLNSGAIATSTTTDGNAEKMNYADAIVQPWYVDDSVRDAPGATAHFDDYVSRPSILGVVSKAGLGPRAH
jgi:prepilin-type N-terminal cleavage/methylation domain-containing protein